MNRKQLRKNYFINKDFQGKYIFSYFVIVLIGLFFFIFLLRQISSDTLSIAYDNFNLQIGKTSIILFSRILKASWIYIISGGILVTIYTMFKTHRIAGPHFVFNRTINEMINGNFSIKIVLRKNDEWKDFAEKMNTFNKVHSKKIYELKKTTQILESQIEELTKSDSIAPENLKVIMEKSRLIKKTLDSFDIDPGH